MQFEVNNFAQWQHFYGLAIALSSASFVRERCLSKTNLGSGPWTCYEFSNLLNCRDTEQEKSRQCSIVRSQKYGVWVRLQIDEDVRVLLSSKNEVKVHSMFDKMVFDPSLENRNYIYLLSKKKKVLKSNYVT